MQKITILLIFMLLVVPLSLQAQGVCDMNLDDEILELVQAQRDADNGDIVLAAHRLQQLSAVLSTIAANCSDTADMLVQEYVASDESIMFQYPIDWVVEDINGTIYLASTFSVFANFVQAQRLPRFNSGETVIRVSIRTLEENESFSQDFVVDILENITGGMEPLETIHPISINEREGFRAIYDTGSNHGVVYQFIDYSDADVPAFIIVDAIGIVDELPITQLYVTGISESIEYLP
jgi:hypothetical protein